MADLVSEVMEDGGTEVTETAHKSNYEVSLGRLDGAVPEPPPLDAVAKLFKPRYVLEVKLEDGTVVPFVYKRTDPATMMMTQGGPLSVGASEREDIRKINNQLSDLRARTTDGESVPADVQNDLNDLLSEPRTQELFAMQDGIQKAVIQANVISPVITDEIYDNLEPDILRALHEAITGGITSQNELVDYFREITERT